MNTSPIALSRAPSKIKPDVEGSSPVNYYRLVKPAFDEKCTPCQVKEGKSFRGTDYWVKSLEPGKDMEPGPVSHYIKWYQASWPNGPQVTKSGIQGRDSYRSIPGKFGARAALLTTKLDTSHHGVKLTDEEYHRITLWFDCNAMGLPTFNPDTAIIAREMRGEPVTWKELVSCCRK